MSHQNFQEAILKLSMDEKYREDVKTDPEKIKIDFKLSDPQMGVLYLDDLNKKMMAPRAQGDDRCCCCC